MPLMFSQIKRKNRMQHVALQCFVQETMCSYVQLGSLRLFFALANFKPALCHCLLLQLILVHALPGFVVPSKSA